MISDVSRAHHQALEILAAFLLDQIRTRLGCVDLTFPVADGSKVQHKEVIRSIAERFPDSVAIVGETESIQLSQRNAVVNSESSIGAVESLVDVFLDIRWEHNATTFAERFLDHVRGEGFHHEHLLRVVVELILRPGLVDDPDGWQTKLVREVDHITAHDCVGENHPNASLDDLLLEIHQEVFCRGVHNLHREPKSFEVLPHWTFLGSIDHREGLTAHEFPNQMKTEIVRPVPLQGVHEHGHSRFVLEGDLDMLGIREF
mmetsp:Transcript_41268/g.129652  ORF Transcript_41268/g.129652 Transcript_41268/m.129652 type:complete len:259 (+) Transcript_41268:2614-3390(+)